MTAPLRIPNRTARQLWLTANLLADPPTGPLDLPALIDRLGLVQLDSIQVVARAQHHILWSRAQSYREPMLDRVLQQRAVFEHFTHDASVLPMAMLPLWRRQFARMASKVSRSGWHGPTLAGLDLDPFLDRIARDGPLSTHAFDSDRPASQAMWRRPPHKIALDYLWFRGDLATSRRDGFTKVYDLAERVFPADLRAMRLPEGDQIDGLCDAALDRLSLASLGEIRKFWEAVEVTEVADWAQRRAGDLVPVLVEGADGRWTKAVAAPDIEARIARLRAPTGRLRILNPFDPAIRDRARLKRLFGFDYTVEMFVPAAKRHWGYYVYPMLEGDRMVGRIEAKADRAKGRLEVQHLWAEPGVAPSKARHEKIAAEVDRLARFVGVDQVHWPKAP